MSAVASKAAPAGAGPDATVPTIVRPVAMTGAEALRIERAISEAVEYLAFLNPTMAALLRMIPQRPGSGVAAMAWATRLACHYSSAYADATLPIRMGVALHEYAHVALGHHGRAARIARNGDPFDATLFNIAADLVINTWLARVTTASRGKVALPDWVVTTATLARAMEKESVKLADSKTATRLQIGDLDTLSTQSTETVHAVLRDLVRPKGGMGGVVGVLEKGGFVGDVVVAPTDPETDAQEEATRRVVVRSLGNMAGSDAWNFAGDILVALPKARIDWLRQMRSLVLKDPGGEAESTWSRVSRRQASFGDFRIRGSRRGDTGRPVLILDTSASITDEEIKGFMAEAGAIANAIGGPVTVMEADVLVARTSSVTPGGPRLQAMKDAGRGGTDFTDALRKADALRPSTIVYLTDLVADAPGYRPRAPVIWCAVGDHPAPGFGRVIRIPGS